MKSFFITGTDTGIGKTLVSRLMIEYFAAQGNKVSGFKPVASGAEDTGQGLRNEDAEILLAASNAGFSYSEINPYVFAKPIAPHIAAKQTGKIVNIPQLTQHYQKLERQCDGVIIEGAGGWQVPLNEELTFADWVSDMQWPVVMVVGLRLGCINHALLSYRDILTKGNIVAGWVANCIDENVAEIEEIKSYLRGNIDAPMLGDIPYLSQCNLSGAEKYVDFSLLLTD